VSGEQSGFKHNIEHSNLLLLTAHCSLLTFLTRKCEKNIALFDDFKAGFF